MKKISPDQFSRRLRWEAIDPAWVTRLATLACDEDLAGGGLANRPARVGDATTESLGAPGTGRARLVARHELAVCGQKLVPLVLGVYGQQLGPVTYEPALPDGDVAEPGEMLGILRGSPATIITAERVLLNFLQRLCGIASLTAQYVEAMGNSPTRLLDTRKTTPGYRVLEKYAVVCGGGWNHRMGLYDRIMLKDNHLAAAESQAGERLATAVRRAREARPDLGIEVEVDALEQIPPVLEAGAQVILLDNFSRSDLKRAISLIGDNSLTEISGGVTLAALPELAALGADFISTGATVHQAAWADIGLDWA